MRRSNSHIYGSTTHVSCPNRQPTDPDCLVMFQHICNNQHSICRISDDEFVKVTRQQLVAICSFKDEIYGIVQHGVYYELVTFHLIGKTVELKSLLINGKRHWVVPEVCRSWVMLYGNYLIESPSGSGEFFFVIRMKSRLSTYSHGNMEFRVFRLDVNGLVCVEVENLDGHTIFIGGYGDGFCCTSTGMGIKPNSIYYTDVCGRLVSVYDLDDRSITPLLPCRVAGRFKSIKYWVDLPGILCLV